MSISPPTTAPTLQLQGPMGGYGGPNGGGRDMPDIAQDGDGEGAALDRVGMEGIEVPVQLIGSDGRIHIAPATADAFVNLADTEAKGIHMSRLFLALQNRVETEPLTLVTISELLDDFMRTHADISTSAAVSIRYERMRKRPALVSGNAGWRTYPVTLSGTREGDRTRLFMRTRIVYSSTCPCSAALARQLIQEQFDADFGGQSSVSAADIRQWLGSAQAIRATPHSQRSHADIDVEVTDAGGAPDPDMLIDRLEEAIKTVVQAAVKREDEQAFALLNGQNLMFCEDAARRLQATLTDMPGVVDFKAKVSHYESLHPHDAVAVVTGGVPGGFSA